MNKLDTKKRTAILAALVEGCSIASTCRMTGAAKNTVLSLLKIVGEACDDLQDRWLRGLNCKRVQCDEIWSFVGKKAKHVRPEERATFGVGDVWTFVAIDADTKLIPCWRLGRRDESTTNEFIYDLSQRITGHVQITTDGLGTYPFAIEGAFEHGRVDSKVRQLPTTVLVRAALAAPGDARPDDHSRRE